MEELTITLRLSPDLIAECLENHAAMAYVERMASEAAREVVTKHAGEMFAWARDLRQRVRDGVIHPSRNFGLPVFVTTTVGRDS